MLILSDGNLTVGTLISFITYTNKLYEPLTDLANIHIDFSAAAVCFQRLFTYLDTPSEIVDKSDAVDIAHTRGSIKLKDVYYKYPERRRIDMADEGDKVENADNVRNWAIENVSCMFEEGKLTCLVGPNGAVRELLGVHGTKSSL